MSGPNPFSQQMPMKFRSGVIRAVVQKAVNMPWAILQDQRHAALGMRVCIMPLRLLNGEGN